MRVMKKIMWGFILLLLTVTTVIAVWKLWGFYRTYQRGKEEYEGLKEYIEEKESQDNKDATKALGSGSTADKCPIKVDFDKLKKINPDVVGWIYIPDTGINYPIVQAKDNQTYLHRTFKGEDSYVGAIFLDALCAPDFSSFNSIIYGHNLKNGEMFGHLKKLYDVDYNKKADYKKHPKVWILTPDDAYEYSIFAFREISTRKDPDVYTVNLPDAKGRRRFFDDQIRKSQKETGIRPSEGERIITLSTCTSRAADGRFVVQVVIE